MGKADAIIISLRDSWKQLLDRRQELKELYENSKPSDEDNEDISPPFYENMMSLIYVKK